MAGQQIATVGSMHVCPMCSGTVPHVGGPITGPGIAGITINGQPVAVMGDMCTCAGPPDTIVQGCPGITANGMPIAMVGSMTAHGGQIMQGIPGVTIESATPVSQSTMPLKDIPFPKITLLDQLVSNTKEAKENISKIKEEAGEDDKTESKTVTLVSDYAMIQVREFAKQFSHASFYLFMKEFFGKEIPIMAYKKLYDDMSNSVDINPQIKVIQNMAFGSFYKIVNLKEPNNYEIADVEIRISEKLIIDAATGETDTIKHEALAKIFRILLEEYGHYLDYLLRYVYSFVAGDAPDDEGAMMTHVIISDLQSKQEENTEKKLTYTQACLSTARNYRLTTFDPFNDGTIEFATATIDGAEYKLVLDFNDLKSRMRDETDRIKADIKKANEEYFSGDDYDPILKHTGHLGIERVLENKQYVDSIQLSHIYLGNYMRDMNQMISPMFVYLKDDEKAKLDALSKGLYGFEWLDSIKPSRETLCRIVELLAAGKMVKIAGARETTEAIGGMGSKLTSPKQASASSLKDKVESACAKVALKSIQTALDYRLFIKHYGGITETELGVYHPCEHMDNPLYAVIYDSIENETYFCPPDEQVPIGNLYGMKRYLRNNEEDGIETNTVKLGKGTGKATGGTLTTALGYIEQELRGFYSDYEKAAGDVAMQNKALRRLGNATHTIEDFFAHTNFTELSLIKMGFSVYPWVDTDNPYLMHYNQNGYFTLQQKNCKEYKNNQVQTFYSEEQITAYYPNFKKLPDFRIQGFYFSTSPDNQTDNQQIYIAQQNQDKSWKVQAANDTHLIYRGIDYVSQLPLVSGYFSTIDSIASLLHLIEEVFKPKEITLKGLLMENDGLSGSNYEQYALDLMDMIVLHLLTDLKLSQKEKGKSGNETGLDYAGLLDIYVSVIEYRQILITVLSTFKKNHPVTAIITETAVCLINAMQTAITNMVKGIIKDVFSLLAKSISAFQNMELHRAIGTDPSHSQLSKDDGKHPLHYLAASQAQAVIEKIGIQLKTYIEQKEKKQDTTITSDDFVNIAKSHLTHPAHGTWMDDVIKDWLPTNGSQIANLNDYEKERKQMQAWGQEILLTSEQLRELYRQFVELYQSTMAMLEQKLNEIVLYIEKLKSLAVELSKDVYDEYNKLMKGLDKKYKKVKSKLDHYNHLVPQKIEKHKEEIIKLIDDFKSETEQTIQRAMDLLNQKTNNGLENIENLQNELLKYYNSLIGCAKTMTPLEVHYYAYAREAVPNDAQIFENYYAAIDKQYNYLQQYLQTPPDTMLANLPQKGQACEESFILS